MRLLPWFLVLPLVAFGQRPSPLANEITATDHGSAKTYIIAADEMAQRLPGGRFEVRDAGAVRSARSTQTAVSGATRLVLYPAGQPRNESTRRLVTEKILVQVRPGTDVASLAARYGFGKWAPSPALPGHFIFHAASSEAVPATVASLRTDTSVISAEMLLARLQKKRARPNDPLFKLQWFLYNTGQSGGLRGVDAKVVSAWGNFYGAGIRGRGVTVGIVDDGVQQTHPDLIGNYDNSLDYDWNDDTKFDQTPSQFNEDFHGTSVAGVVAARGNNRLGVVGVAPQARVTGLRLIADFVDDAQEAEAFLYRASRIAIKNNSWGPNDDGQTMEAPGPIAAQALADATRVGRGGRGTIFVWAAGNGRGENDDSNYDGYANSIYTIAVTAANDRGRTTVYGEGGANVIVAAPSDDSVRSGIVTTDLTGTNGYNRSGRNGELADKNYTGTFGGTSSATPVVSGVVALMLQRNPRLGWRDVQEILLRSATKNNPTSALWISNAAGFHFNHDYGAGLVNASSAVRLAGRWVNLAPQTAETLSDATVEDFVDGGFVSRTFNFPTNQRVEHVTVKLRVTTARRGQLSISLTSPSGTVSQLARVHDDPNNDLDWTYMTVRNWGELSPGTWTLTIQDGSPGNSGGTFQSADVTLFGTLF